jgi:NDP-sugar pyrophosphorylase family protein
MTSAGIIAAGDGSRLRESHPGLVKPLVPVAGVPLCHWVVRSLAGAGARRLTVLVNSRGVSLKESLPRAFPALSWTFLTADTPSSWQSFRLVAGAEGPEAR